MSKRKDYELAYRLIRFESALMQGCAVEDYVQQDGSIVDLDREAVGAAIQSEALSYRVDPLRFPFYIRCNYAKTIKGKVIFNPDGIPF